MTDGPSDYVVKHPFQATNQMVIDYHENGYLILRGLFDKEEIANIEKCVTGKEFMQHHYELEEKENKIIRVVWRNPGHDVTGMTARSHKIVDTCEMLLGGEVYHYHSKLILKDPKVSGPIYWHQDYGYWYHYGNLFPDLLTVFVAVDPSKKANGCLEVLKGSNKCGRLEHHVLDGQNQIKELDRLKALEERLPHVYAEMEPGDALFLHANTLHYSAPNRSDMRRLAFLMCYNKASNDPIMKHHHAQYQPIIKVPDSAIKECKNYTDLEDKDFVDPNKNKTLIGLKDTSH